MTVSEQLRQVIVKCGETRADIARATGVAESVLSRFVASGRGLRSENIDKLCAYLRLGLRPIRAVRRERKVKS
jgi:hypothetical protein